MDNKDNKNKYNISYDEYDENFKEVESPEYYKAKNDYERDIAQQQLEDIIHNVKNKEDIVKHTRRIICFLYIIAILFLIISFGVNIHSGVLTNWPLLTFSLIFSSMPIMLHFSLLTKLFNKEKNSFNADYEHPFISAITKLIEIIITKMNK